MNKHDQNGSTTALVVSLIVVTMLFLGTAGFAFWAFSERQDYKNNVDEKISTAVTLARTDESTKKDKIFAEKEKDPLRTYVGPQAFGSLQIRYPKTWSGYVDEAGRNNSAVDGYFHPGTVPSLNDGGPTLALRVRISGQSYETAVNGLAKLEQRGRVTIEPYSLPSVQDIIGVKVTGQIQGDVNGTLIILPLRDRSIQISTLGDEFLKDFNENILPNVTFVP